MDKRYLGDSVYASYDGYHIILTTENGLPTDPSNRIGLDYQVLTELLHYRDDIISENKRSQANGNSSVHKG